jgi:hypothetical protein
MQHAACWRAAEWRRGSPVKREGMEQVVGSQQSANPGFFVYTIFTSVKNISFSLVHSLTLCGDLYFYVN